MARKLEAALLPPPSDSVGAKILKQMGWRIGQGIGPRLTFRQKQLQDSAFGVAGDPDVDNDEMSEESKHTYAPRDTPLLLPSRKVDVHGLGYQPGTSLHHKSAQGGDSAKGPTISGWSHLLLDVCMN
jgi:G patch domain-containing protein 1